MGRPRFIRGRRAILVAMLALLLVVCFGQIATAQETSRISIDQVIVQEQDGGEITVLVSAVDEGRPILGLTEFEAFIDGRAVQLESIRPVIDAEAGVAVLVLIDVSESMVGEPLERFCQISGRKEDFRALTAIDLPALNL